MSELAAKSLNVTDHAVLRYMERVQGADIEAIRRHIITDDLRRWVFTLGGTGTFPGPDGTQLIIKNSTVITVIK